MTRRFSVLLVVVGLVLALTSVPALAAEPLDVAQDLAEQGYSLESGVDIDGAEARELVSAARRAGSAFFLVVLSEDPNGGATFFAEQVLGILLANDVTPGGTVAVVTPTEIGYVAQDDIYDSTDLDAAADFANDVGGDDLRYTTAFVQGLGVDVGAQVTTTVPGSSSTGGGGGGSGFIVFLVIVGVIGLGVWWLARRSRKQQSARSVDALTEAKAEIRVQLDAVANDVLDLEDRVRVADNDQADLYYQQASATYSSASDVFEKVTELGQLETVSDALDDAAWQLDAAEAILDGRPVPPKPPKEQPGRCFFDPTHKPPYEDATIETSAGNKTVKVCRVDGAKLRQGRMPDSRMINVGGRRVPASQAPRSHGGLGFGGMDLLNILVSGAGMAMGNQRRRSRRSRSAAGGLLGGLFGSGGGRPSRPSRSSRPTRSSSRSSGGSSSRSRSRSVKPGRSRGGRKRRR